MTNLSHRRCDDADCTYPKCDCWEIKRRNCPTRIPKLEAEIERLAKENAELKANNKMMFGVIQGANNYLDINNQTYIGHGSILHREFKQSLIKGKNDE